MMVVLQAMIKGLVVIQAPVPVVYAVTPVPASVVTAVSSMP